MFGDDASYVVGNLTSIKTVGPNFLSHVAPEEKPWLCWVLVWQKYFFLANSAFSGLFFVYVNEI